MTAEELDARSKRLSAFLLTTRDEPFAWGSKDCTTWPARWVAQERKVSLPMPRCRSQDEATAIIEAHGGLVKLWDAHLSALGIFETHQPEVGDVGIIRLTAGREVGVIFAWCRIGYWIAERGGALPIALRQSNIVKAWSV